jgi:glycosyltransferase involved in cell wall biosynthesis
MTLLHRQGAETVGVVIATRGRAAEVQILLERLAQGTRRPDAIVIVGSGPEDWADAERTQLAPVCLASAAPGLTRQRNAGVKYLLEESAVRPDIIVFFDDDFRPDASWLATAGAVFAADPQVEGITGTVLRDGAKTAAISEDEAASLIAAWRDTGIAECSRVPRLYGCNMAVRSTVFALHHFDERLPLYGWLEDLDFSGQLSGRLVQAHGCVGVHLGVKGGRVSGRRYGYSQIVNPLYMAGKGTCPRGFAAVLVTRALSSNLLRSLRRHPLFDYRGRLAGNGQAIIDILRGRMAPERILDL